jgi:hypothetical protein
MKQATLSGDLRGTRVTRTDSLLDSSFLYALFRKDDPDHQAVRRAFASQNINFILPQIVLTEAAWLFNRAGGASLAATFLELLSASELPLEAITYVDCRRASELMRNYAHAKLDFVDCCIISLAERLHIQQVATLDRRDFSIVRTKNGHFLSIVP